MALRKLTYPTYRQPPHVTFGTGSARSLAQIEGFDSAAFLVSGEASVLESLGASLWKQGVTLPEQRVLTKPAGEPTAVAITEGAAWLRANPCTTLVAVGGGSVLDWARLSMACAGGWLDLGSGRIDSTAMRGTRPSLVLVPTTCGSGAEAAAVAVYTEAGRKIPVVSDAFLADRVVLDAQFLAGASPGAIAAWASDALSHGVEAFVSIVPNGLAKQQAVSALQLILAYFAEGDAHCRRERLMEAGYLGGVAASSCSVGVVHAFAHSIASYGVAHGVANAMGLGAGVQTNADTSEMRALLERLRMPSVDALIDAIAPITSLAVAGRVPDALRVALDDSDEREVILSRMAADVCLRTNPCRLDRDGLNAFVDRVTRALVAV